MKDRAIFSEKFSETEIVTPIAKKAYNGENTKGRSGAGE